MAADFRVADDLDRRLDVLERAHDGFARALDTVAEADWHRRTPCTEWDVTALVNHVIGANRRCVLLLSGASVEEVEATRTIDHVRSDPSASFVESALEVVESFRARGASTRLVHHRNGDRTGAELLSMRIRQWSPAEDDVADVPTLDTGSLPAAVEALERRMIGAAMRRHNGNKTRAAEDLKVSRRNLIRLVQKYQLEK
jgi:DNA-binding NtrC family response regulator